MYSQLCLLFVWQEDVWMTDEDRRARIDRQPYCGMKEKPDIVRKAANSTNMIVEMECYISKRKKERQKIKSILNAFFSD